MADEPLFVQVMKAGFGDVLVRHGFEPVKRARAHYVLEGDGVTWRVMLGPARSGDPLAFKDITSLYVHGLDDFAEQFFDRGMGHRLWNTQYLVHHSTGIHESWSRRIHREWKAANPPRRSWFFGDIWDFFFPQKLALPPLTPPEVPYMTEPGKMSRSIWDLNGHDVPVENVAKTVGRFWETEMLPRLQPFLTRDSVLEEWKKRLDTGFVPNLKFPHIGQLEGLTCTEYSIIVLYSGEEDLSIKILDDALERTPIEIELREKQIDRIKKGKKLIAGIARDLDTCESVIALIKENDIEIRDFKKRIFKWIEGRQLPKGNHRPSITT